MSTTDSSAAFEEWARARHLIGKTAYSPSGKIAWEAWQAATEAAKGKGRYCAHCQREADNECKNCKGYGVVTHISGMTPDNYEECNEVCPDCKGEGTEAAKATGTAGELPQLTKDEAEDARKAIMVAMNPAAGLYFPRGWNVIVEKLQAIVDGKAARQPAPVTLSDEQIDVLLAELAKTETLRITYEQARIFARAILAATNRSQP